jgi:plasmid maintenance system antidote protein VapI
VKPAQPKPALTPGDIRAALARLRFPLYQLAARVHVHPARLSPMIHEHRPLPAGLAERIADVLSEEATKS